MRNTNIVLILIITLLTVVLGCKKDDDETTSPGHFNYEGTTYKLSQGVLWGYDKLINDKFLIQMQLMSSGLKLHETGGIADSLTGKGDIIIFQFFSYSQTNIESGEYTFNPPDSDTTFRGGQIYIQYDLETLETEKIDVIDGGVIIIEKDGDNYNLFLNVTTTRGGKVTGNYSGKLKYYEHVDDTKSLLQENE